MTLFDYLFAWLGRSSSSSQECGRDDSWCDYDNDGWDDRDRDHDGRRDY
jgi:hypothetical protein